MVKMNTFRIVLMIVAAWTAKADTVTTRDSSSWNGILTIQRGVLQLIAAFPSGNVTLQFGWNYLRSIEFNTAFYNPGADPSAQLAKLPKPADAMPGTVYMSDKTAAPQACKDITVDSVEVICDGRKLERKGVIRILIGLQ
jgi:hypothetical protein